MAHTAEVLAAFQDGEVRLIFARDKDTDELVLLEDGTAKAQRAYTKASLQCPIRDCPTPHLTTVARKKKRDGYMHLSGGGHAPEGIFHIQGCEMIALWLREKYPAPGFRIQKEERSNSAGERRADVMVTHVATGSRIAFEIQYAYLKRDEWQERHDSYVRQGIPDVWLFGHVGAQLVLDKHTPDQVRLSPTHEAVAASGLRLLWLNPYTHQLGTTVSNGHGPGSTTVDIPTVSGSGRLVLSPLDDFRLATSGVVSTGLASDLLEHLETNRVADAAHRAEVARQDQLRQERLALEAAREAERTIQRAEAKTLALAQRRGRALLAAERLEPAWQATEAYKTVLDRFDGRWPRFLNVKTSVGPGIPMPAGQWQSALFEEFWEGRPTGSAIYESKCVAHLAIPGIPKYEMNLMVREWLEALVAAGYAQSKRRLGWDGELTTGFIVGKPRGPISAKEMAHRVAASVRVEAQRIKDRDREHARRLDELRIAQQRTEAFEADRNKPLEARAPKAVGRSPAEQSSNPTCTVCKRPLFDGQLGRGMHTPCTSGWRA
ncbi:hypothetical protein E3N86_12370 [Cryobacterium sp. Hz7]|uniref:competence protein CoiA family protein n=1 Tax=Cryobacterium sp. Hz7 TaxID=1259166 RepID=UPI00106D76BD|nr:hypothetical protein [Cryobacterium sp. Hz7]TFB59030.1 hypothetical protein E3N86_12370 [Cryobacterium sp. Hz7]